MYYMYYMPCITWSKVSKISSINLLSLLLIIVEIGCLCLDSACSSYVSYDAYALAVFQVAAIQDHWQSHDIPDAGDYMTLISLMLHALDHSSLSTRRWWCRNRLLFLLFCAKQHYWEWRDHGLINQRISILHGMRWALTITTISDRRWDECCLRPR